MAGPRLTAPEPLLSSRAPTSLAGAPAFSCTSLPSSYHPAARHASFTGSNVAEASRGHVMCSRVENPYFPSL